MRPQPIARRLESPIARARAVAAQLRSVRNSGSCTLRVQKLLTSARVLRMSGYAAAKRFKQALPSLEADASDAAAYLSGYLTDPATAQTCADDEGAELEDMLRPTLQLEIDNLAGADIETVLADIKRILLGDLTNGINGATKRGGPKQLEHVFQLGKAPAMSAALLPGAIDVTATNKARETQVDLRKLEKAEAKLRAKADKRAKRTGLDLYEGSKLIDAAAQKKAYEALYMVRSSSLNGCDAHSPSIRFKQPTAEARAR